MPLQLRYIIRIKGILPISELLVHRTTGQMATSKEMRCHCEREYCSCSSSSGFIDHWEYQAVRTSNWHVSRMLQANASEFFLAFLVGLWIPESNEMWIILFSFCTYRARILMSCANTFRKKLYGSRHSCQIWSSLQSCFAWVHRRHISWSCAAKRLDSLR